MGIRSAWRSASDGARIRAILEVVLAILAAVAIAVSVVSCRTSNDAAATANTASSAANSIAEKGLMLQNDLAGAEAAADRSQVNVSFPRFISDGHLSLDQANIDLTDVRRIRWSSPYPQASFRIVNGSTRPMKDVLLYLHPCIKTPDVPEVFDCEGSEAISVASVDAIEPCVTAPIYVRSFEKPIADVTTTPTDAGTPGRLHVSNAVVTLLMHQRPLISLTAFRCSRLKGPGSVTPGMPTDQVRVAVWPTVTYTEGKCA